MRILRSFRLVLLMLALSILPATSYAGVLISVSFGPPPLPVYTQPLCPEPGLIWVPGYWAYGPGGYYWVPGAWAPAPYPGALWTPPYWGWESGHYLFHPGYWGNHVGYYGGINYGFGYFGIGFTGGLWRGNSFHYNTAVMRVDSRYVHDTYRDQEIVRRNTIANGGRLSFNGGPNGIHYQARPEERIGDGDHRMGPTDFQSRHEQNFRDSRSAYANSNNGRPQTLTLDRPLSQRGSGPSQSGPASSGNSRSMQPGYSPQGAQRSGSNGGPQQQQPQYRPQQQQQQNRPQVQQQQQPQQSRPEPQSRPQQNRPSQQPSRGSEHERER